MDFALTDTQSDMIELARRLLIDHCQPEQLRRLEQTGVAFHRELWRQLGHAGLLGIAVPAECGGAGLDFEHLCLLLQEAGRRVAPVPLLPHGVAALALGRHSNADTQRVLEGAASGEIVLTIAWLEPGSDDPCQFQTRAEARGGDWSLQGDKHCVAYGEQADHVVLMAQSDQGPLLCRLPTDAEGIEWQSQACTAGEPQALLKMRDVVLKPEWILARGEDARTSLDWLLQRARAALCAYACGLVEEMLALTVVYTGQRQQFGRVIASFQAVGQRAADCYVDSQCLQLVTQQAVSRLSREQDARREVLVAKVWCGDVSHRISQAAQHLHGGMGVDRDYPLYRYCLWARQVELSLGPSAAMLADLGQYLARYPEP